MKSKILAIVIVCLCINASLYAQNTYNFALTNNTGVDLLYIQLSESNKNTWGADVIPGEVFLHGDTYIVSLPINDETICSHDLKVTDIEGTYVDLLGANLCEYNSITLHMDDDGKLTWVLEKID